MRALAAAIVRFVAWFRLTGLNHERTTRRERAPARRDLSAAFRTAALVAASASFFVTSRADGLAPLTAAQSQALEAAFVELPPVVPAAPPADAAAATEAEYASMVRVGENRLSAGDFETAILAFHRAARESLRAETRTAALAGLARTYRLSGDLVKAVATYERLIADHGDSPETPRHLLELGRTLRATGAPKLAIARFYGVLHTVLKVPTGQTEAYRQLARTAQFEIAETHSQMGNHAEATRFYARLNLLDLAPEDQRRAEFKAAHSRLLAGDVEGGVAALRQFINRHPQDASAAEARFLVADIFYKSGRITESLAVTLDLLRERYRQADSNQSNWSYWQRRTGNQLANQFYTEGDYPSALAIYRCLAELSSEPRWRLPALYQMALCQERLMQSEAARDLYRQIQLEAGASPNSADMAEIGRMAGWRLGQLDWEEKTGRQMDGLNLSTRRAEPPLTPSTS